GFERAICLFSFAVCRERPDQLAVSEIPGDPNPEYKLIPPRQKVRRLTLIGPAWFETVGHTDGRVDPLVPVPVEIPKDQFERTVRVLFPTLIDRCDVQTRCWLLRA